MAIVTRTTAKSYFKTGDKPTQSQFGDFIDSSLFYEDTSDLGRQLVSASSATSARSLLGAGTVGNNLFIATTTASGQDQLGGGTVGKALFEANTTASAQQNIGGGTVGRQIFEAITTASATNIVLQQATSSVIGVSYLSSPITIANNSTTPNTDIDFSGGVMQFSDGSGQAIATAMTKRLQSSGSWSAGTGGNMLLSGARANSSTYHLFALYKTDGTVDYGAMLGVAATTPNPTSILPSGYTKYDYRGSILTDSSGNIRAFFQTKNYFAYKADIVDRNTSFSAGNTLITISTPLGISVLVNGTAGLDIASGSTGNNITMNIQNGNSNFSGSASYRDNTVNITKIASYTNIGTAKFLVLTDTSSQIRIVKSEIVGSTTSASESITICGYFNNNIIC